MKLPPKRKKNRSKAALGGRTVRPGRQGCLKLFIHKNDPHTIFSFGIGAGVELIFSPDPSDQG
jgi:hypothetical protein